MRIFSILLLIGTVSIQLLETIPSFLFLFFLVLILIISSIILIKNKLYSFKFLLVMVSALVLGVILSTLAANHQLKNRLSTEFEGKDIVLQGIIEDIPDNREDGTRFKFKIQKAFYPVLPTQLISSTDNKTSANYKRKEVLKISGVVRLGWFQNIRQIHAGEQWQLKARLKQASGFMNPGGFDYEKWLFTQRVIATGYIRKGDESYRIQYAPWWSINHIRELINQKIQNKVNDKTASAVLSALAVAVRNNLNETQWQLLQKTGTSHLIAISGLHIAIVAGFAFFPVMLIWRIFPRLNEKIPLELAGGIAGVSFAIIYALLAGFTLPTQRALLMVIVLLIGLLSRKSYASSQIMAVALLVVLLFDPLAAMSISFWLSFSAVSLILIILKRQMLIPRFKLLKLQLLLSLGMLPLTLIFFDTGSLSAPLANFIAIPWVSIFVVPITLLGVIFLPLSDFISSALLNLAGIAIEYLFEYLNLLNELPISSVRAASVPFFFLFLAMLAVIFILLPKGFPGRWLSLILLLPALLFVEKTPKQGAFSFAQLDIGQGTASVIHTANHTLIYDTGTRLSNRFDMGKLVVIPYLRFKAVKSVDTMILSHKNLDHYGGAKAIINKIKVEKILSSDTEILKGIDVKACLAGQHWQWDGVNFDIIWPEKNSQLNANNRSCVLRVSNAYHSILLTGDIQGKAERLIIKNTKELLASEVITMPHHGSKTSSTQPFIEAVSPSLSLISAGYRNRFGHPKQDILDRYQALSVQVLDTINTGEIEVDFPEDSSSIVVRQYRQMQRRFWNR